MTITMILVVFANFLILAQVLRPMPPKSHKESCCLCSSCILGVRKADEAPRKGKTYLCIYSSFAKIGTSATNQHVIIQILGTPKKVSRFLGKPHTYTYAYIYIYIYIRIFYTYLVSYAQDTEEWCYREKLKIDAEWQRLNKLSEAKGRSLC